MLDRYTKLILTVIAVCLVWICVRDVRFSSDAYAQSRKEREAAEAQQRVERLTMEAMQRQLQALRDAPPTNVRIVEIGEEAFVNWPSRALVPVEIRAGAVNIGNYPPILVEVVP